MNTKQKKIRQIVLNKITKKYWKNFSTWGELIATVGKDRPKQQIEEAIDLTLKEVNKF